MTHVSVAEAKQHLADLLGRVAYGKERILITRRGKAMAVLVPPESAGNRPHLADVRGWLPNDDPLFAIVDQIVADRLTHKPRRPR